jgi:hypothetical protein
VERPLDGDRSIFQEGRVDALPRSLLGADAHAVPLICSHDGGVCLVVDLVVERQEVSRAVALLPDVDDLSVVVCSTTVIVVAARTVATPVVTKPAKTSTFFFRMPPS